MKKMKVIFKDGYTMTVTVDVTKGYEYCRQIFGQENIRHMEWIEN